MQFNRTSFMWYIDQKCPKPEIHASITPIVGIIVAGLLILSGMGFGGFYAFTKYRQRGNYVEQADTDSSNYS